MIKLELNDQEAGALSQIIDAAVRAGGVRIAIPAGLLHAKLESAAAEAQKAPAPNEDSKDKEAEA